MTRARGRRWARALGVLALFVLAFWLTGCDPAVFWARRAHLRDIVSQLFPPDWSYLSAIVAPLLATLRMSVTGTALGVLLALILAPLCAANLPCPAPVRRILRFLVQVLRSFPALILALLATFLFGLGTFSGPGAFTGVLTLAVCSIGLLSKRFTEAIESLDFRAYDALRAMGVSLLPRIRYAVLPQLGPAFSSAVLYRFDVNIREASVLGLVGAGGIGAPLIFAMNQYAWNDVSAIFLGFVLLVWLIDVGSARLRTRRTAAAAPGK